MHFKNTFELEEPLKSKCFFYLIWTLCKKQRTPGCCIKICQFKLVLHSLTIVFQPILREDIIQCAVNLKFTVPGPL